MMVTGMKQFLHKFDTNGAPVPQFNLQGKPEVRTGLGGIVSLLVAFSTYVFAMHKLQHMLVRKNPLITTNIVEFAVEPSEFLDTTDEEFMMAFALSRFDNGAILADPRYVKWVARLWNVVGQDFEYEYIPLHLCTKDDLRRFNDQDAETEKQMISLVEGKGLFCLDWQAA